MLNQFCVQTDKNTNHSYINLYENLLNKKKLTATNILEVGIGPESWGCGGSVKMWRDYFINANVYAVDILPMQYIWDGIKNQERIKLYTETNGYNPNFVINEFLNKNIKFDMLLDDGPHTLESMKKFIKLYSHVLKEDGILIIEDVQDISWLKELEDVVPAELKEYVKTYDLRQIKNRWDDIVFTIDKS